MLAVFQQTCRQLFFCAHDTGVQELPRTRTRANGVNEKHPPRGADANSTHTRTHTHTHTHKIGVETGTYSLNTHTHTHIQIRTLTLTYKYVNTDTCMRTYVINNIKRQNNNVQT